jgi:hypothetical protein
MQTKSSLWHRQQQRTISLVLLLSLVVLLLNGVSGPESARADEPGAGPPVVSTAVVSTETVSPSQAAYIRVLREFQDIEIDFSNKSDFRLTAVSTREEDDDYSPRFTDEPGAVQLMPVIALEPFESTNEQSQLPVYLDDMGVAALGKYLFVIGGEKRIGEGESIESQQTNEVLVAEVNQRTGQLSGIDPDTGTAWRFDDPLPPVWTNDPGSENPEGDPDKEGEFTWSGGEWENTFKPVSLVSSPAVVAVQKSASQPNSGYIYVIGGTVYPGFEHFRTTAVPSARVQIGRVENGDIVEWLYEDQASDAIDKTTMIPSPVSGEENQSYGLTRASALSFTTEDNRTFLYLIGGEHLIPERTHHSNYVFYAEVNKENGRLYKPGSNLSEEGWEVMRKTDGSNDVVRIPTPDSPYQEDMGLWNTSAIIGSSPQGDALYVVGGERLNIEDEYRYSNAVYRATIVNEAGNDNNGTLSWDEWQGTLPAGPLFETGIASYGISVYLTGGVSVNEQGRAEQPNGDVLISFVNPDLTLGPEGQNFYSLPQKEGDPPPLLRTRAKHGMAEVRAVGAGSVQAFVYAIAGHSSRLEDEKDPDDPNSDQNTNTVLFSKVDLANQSSIFPSSGWYYSPGVDTVLGPDGEETDLVNLEGLYWSAAVSRTQEISSDIGLEYRAAPGSCESVTFDEDDWTSFSEGSINTTFSRPGSNIATLQPEDIQNLREKRACFQYRARLTTNDPEVTPLLLNTHLVVSTEKVPDLYGEIRVAGLENGMNMDVEIWNLYQNDVEKTLDADFGSGKSKKIFIDLFLFVPGEDARPLQSLTFPIIGDDTLNEIDADLHLYAQIDKSLMDAGASFPDPPEDQGQWNNEATMWHDPETSQPITQTLSDILDNPKYAVTGFYTACLAVDSYVAVDDAIEWGNTGYVGEGDENNNLRCWEIDRETEVSIVADDAEDRRAYEKGSQPGGFIISRNNAPDRELAVNFAIEGTATYGEDYVFGDGVEGDPITDNGEIGQVIIPANERSVSFIFTPADDELPEGNETVLLRLWTGSYMLVREKDEATELLYDDDWFVFLPKVLR